MHYTPNETIGGVEFHWIPDTGDVPLVDSYDIDPRNDNRCLQLSFFKFQLDNADQAPIFSSVYYFEEEAREKEDAKLSPKNNEA